MLLHKIQINEYRSCRDVTIALEEGVPLVALVGRNGAGKTNVLRAVEWLARGATSLGPLQARAIRPLMNCDVAVEVSLGDKRYRYGLVRFLKRVVRPETRLGVSFTPLLTEELSTIDENGDWVNLLTREAEQIRVVNRDEPILVGAETTSLPALAALLPPEDPIRAVVDQLMAFLGSIRYYPMEEPMDPATEDEREPLVTFRKNFEAWKSAHEAGDRASVVMRIIDLFLSDQATYDELRSLLGSDGLGVVEDVRFTQHTLNDENPDDPAQQFYFVQFFPSGAEGQYFNYSDLSAGTRRVIRLLVALLYDDSKVMLLEQPEDGIHFGLTSKLLGLLKSYRKDHLVIMTTHSSAILNTLQPESLRMVTMHEGITDVRSLSNNELGAARTFLDDQGSLSDFVEALGD